MTEGADEIQAGRDAWARIRDHEKKCWSDWCAVGMALKIGRAAAMQAAGAKTAHGKKYTALMGGWLRVNGFDDILPAARYRAVQCVDNIAAIEQFRAGLGERERAKLNHPDSIWWNWKRSQRAEKVRAPQRRIDRPRATGCAAPASSDQNLIRVVAAALLKDFSNDTYKMAAAAVAAIRRVADIVDRANEQPAPQRRRPIETAAHATAA